VLDNPLKLQQMRPPSERTINPRFALKPPTHGSLEAPEQRFKIGREPTSACSASGVEASETTERDRRGGAGHHHEGLRQATAILGTRRADLDKGGHLLLARETLTAVQFPAIRPATRQLETVG
jgi:hypothetical protein